MRGIRNIYNIYIIQFSSNKNTKNHGKLVCNRKVHFSSLSSPCSVLEMFTSFMSYVVQIVSILGCLVLEPT
jgi:hypothetical protein